MSKHFKGKIKEYVKVIGKGEECKNCKGPMERRKRTKPPATKTYFFTEWDYCPKCSFVQHYEIYKSSIWKEDESRDAFFKNL